MGLRRKEETHDPVEAGLVFSEPDSPYSTERVIVITFDAAPGFTGAAAIMFGGLNYRCGDGSTTSWTLAQPGVEIAPHQLWQPIAATLITDVPADMFSCDAGEMRAGRVIEANVRRPLADSDRWIARQIATSPMLRYRWRYDDRNADLDRILEGLRQGDSGEHDATALSAFRRLRKLRHEAAAVRDLCVFLIETGTSAGLSHGGPATSGSRDVRLLAASLLGGPLYVPGLWPSTLDPILLELDHSRPRAA